MEDTWEEFKSILKNYPDLFPKGQYNRDLFFWSYELVMTRCYGNGLMPAAARSPP